MLSKYMSLFATSLLKTKMSKKIFSLYFWLFQLVVLKYAYFNTYVTILILGIFIVNLAVETIFLGQGVKKINKLYYEKWKSVAQHIVTKEMSAQKNEEGHWEKLSRITPKLKLIKNVSTLYGFVFLLFNGYLVFYHYLNYLITRGFNISVQTFFYPNQLYIFFGVTILYLWELYILSYFQKVKM